MLSFETNFTFCQVARLNTVLIRPVPIWEFSDILDCLEYSGNSRIQYGNIIPRLSQKPRHLAEYPDDYFSTAPYIWLAEFNRLPPIVKCHLGTKGFTKKLKMFLSALCQHGEFHSGICVNCNLNNRHYSENGFSDITNENLRSSNYSIESNHSMMTRQLLIESDFLTNYFYAAIHNRTNWLNPNVSLSRENFALVGPSLD